jgi:hypothetical protein
MKCEIFYLGPVRECMYKEESVNTSQVDIKYKSYDIRTWEKHLYLDITSTNTDTYVPSLYQYVEIRSIEVFWLLSQPLSHLNGDYLRLSNILQRIFRPSCEQLYATNTSRHKRKTLLYECSHLVLLLTKKKTHNRTLYFGSITTKA